MTLISLAERTQLFGGFEFIRHLSPAVCDVTSHDWKPYAELEPLLYPRRYAIIWMQVGPLCTLHRISVMAGCPSRFSSVRRFSTDYANRWSKIGWAEPVVTLSSAFLSRPVIIINRTTHVERQKAFVLKKITRHHWRIASPILLQCFNCPKIRRVAWIRKFFPSTKAIVWRIGGQRIPGNSFMGILLTWSSEQINTASTISYFLSFISHMHPLASVRPGKTCAQRKTGISTAVHLLLHFLYSLLSQA